MLHEGDAEGFAEKLFGATERVCADYGAGDVVHEEPFSDQLCGRLKETLEDFETENVRWQAEMATAPKGRARLRARTLTKTKEEPLFGADIVMTLDIETDDYSVKKGFLAQAKRLDLGKRLDNSDHRKLLNQCERMLKITPSSTVFLYNQRGVHPIPATAVLSLRSHELWEIVTYSQRILYYDFAICWFGDSRLQATDAISLEGLRTLVDAETAVRFIGRGRYPGVEYFEEDWER